MTRIELALPDIALPEAVARGAVNYVVICIHNGLGDAVLALPLIRYVLSLLGCERVVILGRSGYQSTVYTEFASQFVSTGTSWKIDGNDMSQLIIEQIKKLVPRHADLGWVSLNSYPMVLTEALVIRALRCRFCWRYGSWTRGEELGLPQRLRSDQYFRVVGLEKLVDGIERRPMIRQSDMTLARDLRRRASATGLKLMIIHAEPSSPERNWPTECWLKVIMGLPQTLPVLLGLPGQPLCGFDELEEAVEFSWNEQCGIAKLADVFIGVNSSFSHIADTYSLPGCVLFHRERPNDHSLEQWLPRNPSLKALVAETEEMASIQPKEVLQIVRNQIGL